MGLAHGTIGWADVAVPDMEAGAAFYGGLFGWTADSPESDSVPYSMFTMDATPIAGMGLLGEQRAETGQSAVWSTYIIVDDVDAVFAKAIELGATPIMEPMDVMDAGRMFSIIDPVGAAVGFWQSGSHDGAGVFNVPGAMSWNEIASRDVDAAVAFYTELVGWTTEVADLDGFEYTVLKIGDRSNGGAYDMTGLVPDEVPAHWIPWFIVEDCGKTATTVAELGGSVQRPPTETGVGISAVLSDPFGATFGVIETDQIDPQPPR